MRHKCPVFLQKSPASPENLDRRGRASELVACFQQPGKGLVGFLIRKMAGKALVDGQRFQRKLQLSLGCKLIETIGKAAAGKDALGPLQVKRPHPHTQKQGFCPVTLPGSNKSYPYKKAPKSEKWELLYCCVVAARKKLQRRFVPRNGVRLIWYGVFSKQHDKLKFESDDTCGRAGALPFPCITFPK